MAARATASSFLGIIKEVTRGTYVAPSGGLWIPYKSPAPEDNITYLEGTGLQGSMVAQYSEAPGVNKGVFSFTTDFFTDTSPGLFQAILGGTDVAASVGGGNFTHTFSLLNNSTATGNQPTSWSLTDFDGYEARGYPGAALGELDFKWQADGLVECDTKWINNLSASVATPSSSYSTNQPVPAWEIVASVGGSTSTHIEVGEIDFKRKTEQPFTGNATQSAFINFLGTLDVSFKLTCLAEDDTEYNYFRNNTQPTLSIMLTDPASLNTFQILANTAAFTVGKPIRSKEYLEWDVEGKLVPNTTNATSGGVSPVKIIATNTRSTAY